MRLSFRKLLGGIIAVILKPIHSMCMFRLIFKMKNEKPIHSCGVAWGMVLSIILWGGTLCVAP
jgi:hypothetical protein